MAMNQSIGRVAGQLRGDRRTRIRFVILATIFVGTVLNYLDRINLSVASPLIKNDLHLNAAELGLILSAFGWTYAAMQIPGGLIVDRFGTRVSYGVGLLFWSAFTVACGFTRSFAGLFGLRLGLGLAEAPAFPSNNRLVAMWFPPHERGLATSVYISGEYVGQGFLLGGLAWVVATFDWPAVFIVTGVISFGFALVWFALIREPGQSRQVNTAELEHIRSGEPVDAAAASQTGYKPRLRQIRVLLRSRQMWGIYIGQFSINAVLWFFLTWFPDYLVNAKGFSLLQMGFAASIPYIAAFCGVLVSGWFSDWMIRRGISISVARKLPIILGLLLACSIVLANYTASPMLVILIMSVAFFAQGFSHISWALVAETSPHELVGLAGGVFNFAGNLAAFIIPSVFGAIVALTGGYQGGLVFIAGLALIGALSYIFIVGPVHRVRLDEQAG